MTILTNRALRFTKNEGADDADEFETQPGRLQWAPNWIENDPAFAQASANGDLRVINPALACASDYEHLSWPSAVDYYEMHESMKQMLTGPRKEIPADLFLLSTAREHGISVNEITKKQLLRSIGQFAQRYGVGTLVPDVESEPHQNEGSQQKEKAGSANARFRSETGTEPPLKDDEVFPLKPGWDPERHAIVLAYISELLALGVCLPVQSKHKDSVCGAARVHPADFYKWIKGQKKPGSAVDGRIRDCCQTEKPHLTNRSR